VIAGFILLSRKIATSGGCPPRNDADADAGAGVTPFIQLDFYNIKLPATMDFSPTDGIFGKKEN
jgi:hypothetical protein